MVDVEAAASLSAGRCGWAGDRQPWHLAEARPQPLRSSVSCPSSQLLTLLPTCSLRPMPGASWTLQTTEVAAKPE